MDKILIVDDEPGVRHFLRKIFAKEYEVETAKNGEDALQCVRNSPPDLILLDLKMPGIDGLETLEHVHQFKPDLPVVLMTAFGNTDKAIHAIEAGAFDYMTKPLDIDTVRDVIQKGLKASHLMRSAEIEVVDSGVRLKGERLIGNSGPMVKIYKIIGQVAKSDVPILIRGESGTGKNMVARTLHQYSLRSEQPFVTVNCAAIPEDLIESELCGYEEGVSTSAETVGEKGKFETAQGGTLFLDNIGDMPSAAQLMIINTLQDGCFRRIGRKQPFRSDVRILAATNRNLENLIHGGLFREDLFHRLNIVNIKVPPLRERKEDLPALVEYFIQRFNSELQLKVRGVEPGLIEYLKRYDWPGNVRELENIIKKDMIMCKYDYLSLDQIQDEIPMHISGEQDFDRGFSFIVENALQRCIESCEAPYECVVTNVEKVLVKKALDISKWNQVQAAKLLGITRTTLRKKMKKFGL